MLHVTTPKDLTTASVRTDLQATGKTAQVSIWLDQTDQITITHLLLRTRIIFVTSFLIKTIFSLLWSFFRRFDLI